MDAKVKELKQSYASKIAEAKTIMASATAQAPLTQELSEKVDKLLGEADVIKVQISQAEKISDGEAYSGDPADTKAAHLGWRQSGPNEGMPVADPLAWRKVDVDLPTGRKVQVRFLVPLAVQSKGYPGAFEGYMRKGMEQLGPLDRKTITEGIDSSGGFFVPEDYQTELIRKTATSAMVRALARVMSTSRDAMKWPRIVYTTDDKYTSGVRLTWTGEVPSSSTVHRVTEPVSGLITIPVHTAMASMPLSNDVLEDSAFDLMGISSDLLGEAFALGEDDVFINGNGVAKPMGLVTRIDVGETGEKIPTVVSGSATTLLADGLIDLFFGLPSQYRRNARMLLNSGTAKVARKLKDGNSRYIWDSMQNASNGGLSSPGDQDSMLGKPVVYDEFMPDIAGNDYPILFGDFSGYFIVDRIGLSLQRLSEIYAETNITVILGRKRVGGEVA